MGTEEMNGIRKRIKKRREELGYSYQNVADITGMSKSTLQRYETGDIGNLPLDKLEVLANALECSPSYLMGWTSDPTCRGVKTIAIQDKVFVEGSLEYRAADLADKMYSAPSPQDAFMNLSEDDKILVYNFIKMLNQRRDEQEQNQK